MNVGVGVLEDMPEEMGCDPPSSMRLTLLTRAVRLHSDNQDERRTTIKMRLSKKEPLFY